MAEIDVNQVKAQNAIQSTYGFLLGIPVSSFGIAVMFCELLVFFSSVSRNAGTALIGAIWGMLIGAAILSVGTYFMNKITNPGIKNAAMWIMIIGSLILTFYLYPGCRDIYAGYY